MGDKFDDITLSFAGAFQAASLVDSLAKTGLADEKAYTASIESIYKLESKTLLDIYGSHQNLGLGLKTLVNILDKNNEDPDTDISTYVISLLYLERKLSRDSEKDQLITRRLQYVLSQVHHFSSTHPQVISNLADIYLQSLGSYPFRIKVIGKPIYLNNPDIINKIRALLLAGIRAMVLWQQMGGSRWQLLFSRAKMVRIAREILAIIKLST